MKSNDVKEQSYKHTELEAAAIRNCRAKNGDYFRQVDGFTPAGKVVMGQHGAVTARCDIHGFGFTREADFEPNATIEVDGERIQVMARIEGGQILGGFFARREGGFYSGNRKVTNRREARQIGCFGHAKDARVRPVAAGMSGA